uniref:SNF1-related protein kinase regulatory subunit gamma-1-like protein n=1 Tax=Lygus hesperus TaxID=30085 RepID=A0A0A9X4Q9_LYGHE
MKQSECLYLIKNTDRAIDAFRKISETGVSGLPVVDNDGALCDSISVRDLRAVGTNGENFSRLFLTIQEFKSISREEFPHVAPASHWTTQPVPKSARYVTPDDDFEVVIRSMNDGNMHRIFVCSQMSIDTNKPTPISVISQRDIIYTVLRVLGTISE